jgi:hypothetical protein
MKKSILFFLLLFLIPVEAYLQQDEMGTRYCDTFLGSINDVENECEPCVNGMEKLLQPMIKFKDHMEQIASLNATLSEYLADQQAEIDRLVNLQGDITSEIYNWNIGDLDGGFSSSDTDYIDHFIEQELESYQNRFGEDYPYIQEMMDNWKSELLGFKELMEEEQALQNRLNELLGRLNGGEFGDFNHMNYDCCDDDTPFSEDQLNALDDFLSAMETLLEDYLNYRATMVEMTAHFTELLKSILFLRAVEEGTMEERRDQYSDGLFAFLIGEMVDALKTEFVQQFGDEGINLNSTQQDAVAAFAEAAGPKIETLISGGVSGISNEMVNDVIALAAADMSENDRAALQTIGGEIWSEIAGRLLEKYAGKLLEKSAGKFALQGLGTVASLPITLWEQLITVPVYLWADRDLQVLKGAYDRAVMALLIAIKLGRDKQGSGPYELLDAYVDALKGPTNRAIRICLPERDPPPANPDEFARAFLEELFGEGSEETLSNNDEYRMKFEKDRYGDVLPNSRMLQYNYSSSKIRILVRFGCFCGVWREPSQKTPHTESPSVSDETPEIWEQIELASEEAKLIEKKPFPWWIPVTGAVSLGGGITYWLYQSDIFDPSTGPVSIASDLYEVPCNSPFTFNVLDNDSGDELVISDVEGGNSGVALQNLGNSIYTSNVGMNDFEFNYTITDAYGTNVSTFVNVYIVDMEAPVITCPPDMEIPCDSDYGPEIAGFATATDNCTPSAQLNIDYTDDLSQLTASGLIQRTWQVVDQNENSAVCLQKIQMMDTEAPVIECPPDISIGCSENTEPANTGYPTVSDDCTPVDQIVVDYSDQSGEGLITRSWTATDKAGKVSSCTQTITQIDDEAPVIECPPDISIGCNANTEPANTGYPTVSDDCTPVDQIVVDYSDQSGEGLITRSWTATDKAGKVSSCTQTITQIDDEAPVIECPPDISIGCNANTEPANTGYPTVSDDCTPVDQIVVDYSDQSGEGLITRSWTATDKAGKVSSCTQTITQIDDEAPVIECPPDISIGCNANTEPANTGYPTVSDDCTPVDQIVVDYSDQSGEGLITRSWTATDKAGKVSSCTQIITQIDDEAPVIECPPDISIGCNANTEPANTGYPTVSDDCTPVDQIIVDYSDQSGEGLITRSWTATDKAGKVSSCTQIITLLDEEVPVISCPPDRELSCGASTDPSDTGYPTVSDNCTPHDQIAVDYADATSDGLILRTWTAVDLAGNMAQCEQRITLMDTEAPNITCPVDITVNCEDGVDASITGWPIVSDNCSSVENILLDFEDVFSGVDITRTWTATDEAGNTVQCVQQIMVLDEVAPELVCPPDLTIACDESVDPSVTGSPQVVDNCTDADAIEVEYSDDISGEVINRTWVASDAYGNQSSCVQVISMVDDISPVINCPDEISISCDGSTDPSITGNPTVSDNCTTEDEILIEYSDEFLEKSINRTWMATDEYGNMASCTQKINLLDEESPLITCPSAATVSCEQSYDPEATGEAFATDNCTLDEDLAITYMDDLSALNECNSTGIIIRTFSTSDAYGNESFCEQQITVTDEVAPEITCPPDLTVASIDESQPEITGYPEVSDNCTATDIEVTYSDDMSDFDGISGTITRFWTAADPCGNAASCNQLIVIDPLPCTFSIEIVADEADCGLNNGGFSVNWDMDYNPVFQWSSGDEGPTVNDLAAGEYQLTVTESEIHCYSVYNVDLPALDPDYDPNIQVDAFPCPGPAILYLDLETPGDGIFNLHILGNGVDETLAGIQSTFIPLHEYLSLWPGDYLLMIYDESMGPECVQEYDFSLGANETDYLILQQVNPPNNADQNNGSAIFSIDQTLAQPPYMVYLNGNYWGEVWEPGFTIGDLTNGEYFVEIYDVNGCPAIPVPFTLFGSGLQEPSGELYLTIHDCCGSDLSDWVIQDWLEDLNIRNAGELTIQEHFRDQVLIIPLPKEGTPQCVNLSFKKPYREDWYSAMGLKVGQFAYTMVLKDESGGMQVFLPLQTMLGGIELDLGKDWHINNSVLGLRLTGAYDVLNLTERSSALLSGIHTASSKDMQSRALRFGFQTSFNKDILENVKFNTNLGLKLSYGSLAKWDCLPVLQMNVSYKLLGK